MIESECFMVDKTYMLNKLWSKTLQVMWYASTTKPVPKYLTKTQRR